MKKQGKNCSEINVLWRSVWRGLATGRGVSKNGLMVGAIKDNYNVRSQRQWFR